MIENLLYIGTHIDADLVINIDTVVILLLVIICIIS